MLIANGFLDAIGKLTVNFKADFASYHLTSKIQ